MFTFVTVSFLPSLAMILSISSCSETEDHIYNNTSHHTNLTSEYEKTKNALRKANEHLIKILQQTCFLDKAERDVRDKIKEIKIWNPKRKLTEIEQELLSEVSEYCVADLAIDLTR